MGHKVVVIRSEEQRDCEIGRVRTVHIAMLSACQIIPDTGEYIQYINILYFS